jgi:hypothetical protein
LRASSNAGSGFLTGAGDWTHPRNLR